MDKFDLFNLVRIKNNHQYLKSYSIQETTMYTLYDSLINDNISIIQTKTGQSN